MHFLSVDFGLIGASSQNYTFRVVCPGRPGASTTGADLGHIYCYSVQALLIVGERRFELVLES